jgi:hypothetical protein
MAQADFKNSITAPAVSRRRRFLSQAAGVAAGGTVLALATISPASAAAAPRGLAGPGIRPNRGPSNGPRRMSSPWQSIPGLTGSAIRPPI